MISRTTSAAHLRASFTPRSTWSQLGRRRRSPAIAKTSCLPARPSYAGLVPGRRSGSCAAPLPPAVRLHGPSGWRCHVTTYLNTLPLAARPSDLPGIGQASARAKGLVTSWPDFVTVCARPTRLTPIADPPEAWPCVIPVYDPAAAKGRRLALDLDPSRAIDLEDQSAAIGQHAPSWQIRRDQHDRTRVIARAPRWQKPVKLTRRLIRVKRLPHTATLTAWHSP